MKKIFTVLSILVATLSYAQTGVRITEISYNPPESGADSTEYIELYNPTSAAINLNGYSFTSGVVYTFGNVTIPASGYVVVCVDSIAMQNRFGVTAYEWTAGGLSNGGEPIALKDGSGALVDSLRYDDNSPWPTSPDSYGPSLVLCDLNADQTNGANWDTSSTSVGVVVNGHMVYGSPGAADNSCIPQPADLVITEIMYNTPSSDTFEFIEIYNNGSSPVDLTGYHFTQGVTDTLPSVMLPAGGYITVTIDSVAFYNVFGFSAYEWESGALSNSGEDITLVDNMGVTLDSVDYDDGSPWPTDADGMGYSLVLTDPNSDNLLASSWCLSGDIVVGQVIAGSQILASPGSANTCYVTPAPTTTPTYAISVINNTDMNGVADSIGVYCWTKGLVLGVDMRGGSGIQFTIFDGEGIGIFDFNDVSNYVVTEGDSIMIRGTVGQFNGLTQLGSIDSISVVNTGNAIPSPTVVTALTESTESTLVRFENVYVSSVSGINFELVSGTDTITMRVDSDTDVLDSLSIAMGDSLCHVIGIVGQFDSSNPYTSGYQLFPRTYMDIDTTCGSIVTPPAPPVPTYDIATIRTVDANGEPDSLDVLCAIEGIVHGKDMDGNAGYTFALIDDTRGITVHSFVDVDNYVVNEGDELRAVGTVKFYNGLTQFRVDTITVLSTGNCIEYPEIVFELNEETESEAIYLTQVKLEDPSAWPAPGSNANLNIITMDDDTLLMRIDKDTKIADTITSAPSGYFNVSGIGSQFTFSTPANDGYQIMPQFVADIDTVPTDASGIFVNEAMVDNQTAVADPQGDYDSWIEIYNSTSNPFDLTGNFFGNDDTVYRFERCIPAVVVPANGYLLLWADDEMQDGPEHLPMMLNNEDFVGLLTKDAAIVDTLEWDSALADVSFGHDTDGSGTWVSFEESTPNATNSGGVILSVISVDPVNALNAYPNPVSNGNVNFNKVISFNMYSVTGQLMMQRKNVNQLNVSDLEKGIYIIETTEGEILKVIVK